jgi:hypothetical protein
VSNAPRRVHDTARNFATDVEDDGMAGARGNMIADAA